MGVDAKVIYQVEKPNQPISKGVKKEQKSEYGRTTLTVANTIFHFVMYHLTQNLLEVSLGAREFSSYLICISKKRSFIFFTCILFIPITNNDQYEPPPKRTSASHQ